MQDLLEKSYKTLIKEIKEDLNKCRDILCSLIGRLSILVLLNLIYRFNAFSIKISASYFMDIEKLIIDRQEIQNNQYNTEEEQSLKTDTT